MMGMRKERRTDLGGARGGRNHGCAGVWAGWVFLCAAIAMTQGCAKSDNDLLNECVRHEFVPHTMVYSDDPADVGAKPLPSGNELRSEPWAHVVRNVPAWKQWGHGNVGVLFIGGRTDASTKAQRLVVVEVLAPTIFPNGPEVHDIELHAFSLPRTPEAGRGLRQTVGYMKILLPGDRHLRLGGAMRDAANAARCRFEALVAGESPVEVEIELRGDQVVFTPAEGRLVPEGRGVEWFPTEPRGTTVPTGSRP
jgi:hypothetical protein